MPTKQTPRSAPYRTTLREGYDLITGEQHVIASEEPIPKKVLKNDRPGYAALSENAYRLDISATQFRIVLYLLSKYSLEERPVASVTQAAIQEELCLSRQAVQGAMRELQARRIIYAEGRGKWFVNPHIGYRGGMEAWDRERWQMPLPLWNRDNTRLRLVEEEG